MASSFFVAALLATGAVAQQSVWGQCGGVGWSGATTCVSGSTCTKQNDYYYQCLPGGNGGGGGGGGNSPTTTSSSQPSTPTGGNGGGNSGKTQYFGVNIAGFDFGCKTDGTCTISQIYPPLRDFNGAPNNRPDGVGQMQHFKNDLGMNMFRLPVGWQYLVNNNLGGTLDSNSIREYDRLVQGCRATGAQCIIDIHNYARWNGGIVGQGGPSDDQFVSLWRQLATKYASQSNVWFGVMNEPHDVNINTWAQTVQKVVTAIRQAGATNNYITIPGNGWQSAGTFLSDGSAAALSNVKNPDGTTNRIVFDFHKYLDSDNSGTTTNCVKNNIDDAFKPVAEWLRQNKRQAVVTETGGGNTDSCLRYFCEQIKYINSQADVYLGYTGWSAGSFDGTYELVLTPTWNGNGWTDRALTKCLLQ